MAALDDAPRVEPTGRAAWRAWLEANHATSSGAWVVFHTKASGRQVLSYEELVEELLCFGWVDATTRSLGDGRTAQYVAPRKPGSTWAATNKARVERLTAAGLMAPAGAAAVARAKADGSWTVLDAVEALEVPPDLEAAFAAHPMLRDSYDRLGPGGKKQVLWSLVSAKRQATRASRLTRLIERAETGQPLLT